MRKQQHWPSGNFWVGRNVTNDKSRFDPFRPKNCSWPTVDANKREGFLDIVSWNETSLGTLRGWTSKIGNVFAPCFFHKHFCRIHQMWSQSSHFQRTKNETQKIKTGAEINPSWILSVSLKQSIESTPRHVNGPSGHREKNNIWKPSIQYLPFFRVNGWLGWVQPGP